MRKGKEQKKTEGDYASAWINHGLAPENANYKYVIYPFNNEAEINNFDRKVKDDKSYTILRADSIAHIVKDLKTKTTGYVVFEAENTLENGLLKEVSKPALVMLKEDGANNIVLSVVQPDLNFPEYKKGKFRNYSEAVELKITINGNWSAINNKFITAIDYSIETGTTTVTLNCKDGFSRKFQLNKQ